MAVLNITTNKTRAQMVTELTDWANGTKVNGDDYTWICADTINVTASIDISGFTLLFANDKIIQSNAGGTITVSGDIFNTYTRRTFIHLIHTASTRRAFEIIIGTGKWVGKGLTFILNGGDIGIDSNTSITNIADVDIIGISSAYATEARIGVAPTGEVNLLSITGCSLRFRSGSSYGKISMNPIGRGFISGDRLNSTKLLVNSTTIDGFVVQSSSARKFSVQPYTGSTYTLSFKDGSVNPDFLVGYPQASTAICKLQRTITFKPKDTSNQNVSGFTYRVSSNRIVEPAGTTTENTQISTQTNKAYGYQYVMTVWNGVRPTGGGTYNPFRDLTIDKDMRVQYRKYGLREAIFSSNSYNFAVDAPAIMATDEFASTNTTLFKAFVNASQFYDFVRSICETYLTIPEDLLITDGKVLTIKTDWKLKRSATATSAIIYEAQKEIVLDKDSYLAKMNTGIFRFDTIAGFVDDSMTGHTNMAYARNDGKATLNVEITCPAGATDPIVGIWPFSQGVDVRNNMITGTATGNGVQTISLLADPAIKYYCVAKANGTNQYSAFAIDPIGALGTTVKITLFVYKKADGTPILPVTLTTEQTAIADMFIFDSTNNDIDIKIPTDFASNARWSATDKMWQFTASDFIAIAWKLDRLQTVVLFLHNNQLLYVLDGSLLVSATASSAILEQDSTNQATVGGTEPPKISFTTISIGRIGDTNARNTFIDNSNGTIDVRGGTPVSVSVSGGFTASAAAELTAVKTETDKLPAIQTKADETHQRLALDATKPLTSKPDGGITSTGIAITATELADGSVVQTRGT